MGWNQQLSWITDMAFRVMVVRIDKFCSLTETILGKNQSIVSRSSFLRQLYTVICLCPLDHVTYTSHDIAHRMIMQRPRHFESTRSWCHKHTSHYFAPVSHVGVMLEGFRASIADVCGAPAGFQASLYLGYEFSNCPRVYLSKFSLYPGQLDH